MWNLQLFSFFLTFFNPFQIPFEDKKEIDNNDTIEIQSLLRQVNTKPKLMEYYPVDLGLFERFEPVKEFESRITRCLKQVLIDPQKGLLPERELVKINEGGEDCFVLCCPLNGIYPQLLKSLIQGLKEIGFNGYVYYRIGGFPNPTGKEAKWAGVPYSFKLFMMMEAHQLGLQHLIWLDCALFPFKNPQSLFQRVRDEGSLMLHRKHPSKEILPVTKSILEVTTQVDVSKARHVRMWVFGLDMGQRWAKTFLEQYTHLVQLGTPFISCYPEEFVISALAHAHKNNIPSLSDPLLVPSYGYGKIVKTHDQDAGNYWRAREDGYMFVVRNH